MDRAVNAASCPAAGALALALMLGGPPAAAQVLLDPTRPPAALVTSGAGLPAATPGTPELQSVLISRNPGGRKVAVISGQTVRVGSKVGGAVVTRISQTEVVLARGKTVETLKLFPRPATDAAKNGSP